MGVKIGNKLFVNEVLKFRTNRNYGYLTNRLIQTFNSKKKPYNNLRCDQKIEKQKKVARQND